MLCMVPLPRKRGRIEIAAGRCALSSPAKLTAEGGGAFDQEDEGTQGHHSTCKTPVRRDMSLPEAILWECLRGRRLNGLRFRRQHPVGPYVLDFFHEARLAIEVDGTQHDLPAQFQHDLRRDGWLAEARHTRDADRGERPAGRKGAGRRAGDDCGSGGIGVLPLRSRSTRACKAAASPPLRGPPGRKGGERAPPPPCFAWSPSPASRGRTSQSLIFSASMKADCGISTLPNWRMRFLPSFCFSRSLRLRVTSPP
jgi:very-short-patch-repair endonuclease